MSNLLKWGRVRPEKEKKITPEFSTAPQLNDWS
jgi:hypothetical protein